MVDAGAHYWHNNTIIMTKGQLKYWVNYPSGYGPSANRPTMVYMYMYECMIVTYWCTSCSYVCCVCINNGIDKNTCTDMYKYLRMIFSANFIIVYNAYIYLVQPIENGVRFSVWLFKKVLVATLNLNNSLLYNYSNYFLLMRIHL